MDYKDVTGGMYMNVYGTSQIRNVVLLGHGGAGKTTVAERSEERRVGKECRL